MENVLCLALHALTPRFAPLPLRDLPPGSGGWPLPSSDKVSSCRWWPCPNLATRATEIKPLGYPKAALFGFRVALVTYNVLAVVKAALRRVHGEEKIANEVSGYYLAGQLRRTYEGMMIAVPENVFINPGARVGGGVNRSGLFWYAHGGVMRVGVK